MIRLYDYLPSGNGYKVRLVLNQLGVAFERVELDIVKGETRTPEFLALNPNGRVPIVVFEDGRVLPESNAIIWHFAEGSPLLPAGGWERAQVLQWLFFEQNSHEPNIATVRHWVTHLGRGDDPMWAQQISQKRQAGRQALMVMDKHLTERRFFVADTYTIADVALYAYTHVADEGGFDLGDYPAILGWFDRVAAQPRHTLIGQL